MSYRVSESGVEYRGEGIVLRAEPWGRNGMRIRIRPEDQVQTSDWALDLPAEHSCVAALLEHGAAMTNGKLRVTVSDRPTQPAYLEFHRRNGREWLPILAEKVYPEVAHNPGTHHFRHLRGGLEAAELRFEARTGEHFYGMGQNDTDTLDLKGCVIDLYQRHTKAPVPFVVSSLKYGFLWNNPSLGRVEFARNLTRWTSRGTRQIDFYVTADDTYAEILENYTSVTGRAPAFPAWASGFWQCKLRYKSQDEVLQLAAEFKRRKLPVSVIVIDYYHWKNFGDWKADPEFWPDLASLAETLRKDGIRLMISPWTLVAEEGGNYAELSRIGGFTRRLDSDDDPIFFDRQTLRQYDPTHPRAAAILQREWKRNFMDKGILSFWLDPCDDFHEIDDYDKVLYHIGPAVECHSMFVVAHQKNVCEALRKAGCRDICGISRNAWAGTQRYGTCPAPHDINATFRDMRVYFKAGLNVMMSGIPWWNCDIGGFNTLDLGDHFRECLIRWYQWGVFMPVFRTHGARPGNEPWSFGEEVYEHLKAAILMRERLRPYLHVQMDRASASGLPPVRPLFFDFDGDERTYAVEDEEMFGPDILVAPVLEFRRRNRRVYLPAGTDWIDVWSGGVLSGGREVEADAPLTHIPVYVRASRPELRTLLAP